MKVKDRMEESELQQVTSRFDPTPIPFTWHVREEIEGGCIVKRMRRKMYSSILGLSSFGDWETVKT